MATVVAMIRALVGPPGRPDMPFRQDDMDPVEAEWRLMAAALTI